MQLLHQLALGAARVERLQQERAQEQRMDVLKDAERSRLTIAA
jgi:hypothetical protein